MIQGLLNNTNPMGYKASNDVLGTQKSIIIIKKVICILLSHYFINSLSTEETWIWETNKGTLGSKMKG